MKKKLLYLILLCILFIPFSSYAIVEQSEEKYVTDTANVLSDESKDYIIKYSDFLYKQKKIGFYVVTVYDLEGIEIEDYSSEIYNIFHLNEKSILILTSTADRKIRIEVGSELKNTVTNELIEEYYNTYFSPYFERNEWNNGIINGYSAIYKYICTQYGIDASSMEVVEKFDFLTKYTFIIIFGIMWSMAYITNYYATYYRKSKDKKYAFTWKETLYLILAVVANIFSFAVAYLLKPIYVILVLMIEGFDIYSLYLNSPKKNKKN